MTRGTPAGRAAAVMKLTYWINDLEAENGRLRAENDNLVAIETVVISDLKRKLDDLAIAVRPILRAHCSTTGHVTEEQITAAWAAYDAARRDA